MDEARLRKAIGVDATADSSIDPLQELLALVLPVVALYQKAYCCGLFSGSLEVQNECDRNVHVYYRYC